MAQVARLDQFRCRGNPAADRQGRRSWEQAHGTVRGEPDKRLGIVAERGREEEVHLALAEPRLDLGAQSSFQRQFFGDRDARYVNQQVDVAARRAAVDA